MLRISVFGGKNRKLHFITKKAYDRGLAGGAFRDCPSKRSGDSGNQSSGTICKKRGDGGCAFCESLAWTMHWVFLQVSHFIALAVSFPSAGRIFLEEGGCVAQARKGGERCYNPQSSYKKKTVFSLSLAVLAGLSLSPEWGLYQVVYYYSTTVPAGLPLSYRPLTHDLFNDSGKTCV